MTAEKSYRFALMGASGLAIRRTRAEPLVGEHSFAPGLES
jgi:hypothetical protein